MVVSNAGPQKRAQELHQRSWESLPWYANGTLHGEELEITERHVTNCVTCRSELRFLQGLGVQIHSSDDLAVSAQIGLSQIMSRIDRLETTGSAEPEQTQRAIRRSGFRWLKDHLRLASYPVQGALAVQAMLIVALIGLLVTTFQATPDSTFHTLATPAPRIESSAPQLRILFSEQATEKEIRTLIHELDAQVVAGPSPLGVYSLSIETVSETAIDLNAMIEDIRAREVVRFVDLAAGYPQDSIE